MRAITRLVRRRGRTDRAWLDERLGPRSSTMEGEVGHVEPDELVGAAERAVDELPIPLLSTLRPHDTT